MRLWHIDLITALPREQLLAQWRELNSIFVKQDRHILINYIYDYPKDYLYCYSLKVMDEMTNRGYSIRSFYNFNTYFNGATYYIGDSEIVKDLKFKEHDDEYFKICYYNLKEKYIRGQKGFTTEIWNEIEKCKNKLKL